MSVASILKKNDWPEIKEFLKESSPDILDFFDIGTADETSNYEKNADEELTLSDATRIGDYSEFLFALSLCRKIEQHKDRALSSLMSTLDFAWMQQMGFSERVINKAFEIKATLTSYANGTETDFSALVYASHFSSVIDKSPFTGVSIAEDMLFEEVPSIIQNTLRAMVEKFENTFSENGLVNPNSIVLYHPTFEPWGTYLGGAEADLYVDGCLYEIKSGKREKNKWIDVGQVYAYYLLNQLCERYKEETTVSDLTESFNIGCSVDEIAIYYSRTGVLKKCPIKLFNYYRKKQDEVLFRRIIITKINDTLKDNYEKNLSYHADMILRRRYREIQSGKREINQYRKEQECPFAVGERLFLLREGWGNIEHIFQNEQGLTAFVSMDNGNKWRLALDKIEVICINDLELEKKVPKPHYLTD